jgi:signal transduction histidine kinase/ActR/RegA family two-component response regulator
MDAESVLAHITDNPRLPTPPTLTMRILERASLPSCTLAEIGKIIGQDPALCGKMLRLVNSSLFGLQRSVTSIERALSLLGLNHVRSLVLGLSLPSLRFRSASSEQMKAYWKSSVTAAIVCRELALRRKWPDPDSEMVAGLLCDVGILLLQETFPEKYARVSNAPTESLDRHRCELEEKEIGVNHALAGAHCMRRWNLPDDLTTPIQFHHHPEQAPATCAARAHLLHFASQVVHIHQMAGHPALLGDIVALAKQRYDMNDEQLFSFLESLQEKITGFAALVNLDLGPCESFASVFTKATENLTKLAVEASLDSFRATEEKNQVEQGLMQAKEALQRTEEQLRQAQKMEAIGRMAGGVAHDFNNLLTVIIGNCDVLLDMPNLLPDARDLVQVMMETGNRGAELTRQLLAFSRKQFLAPDMMNLNFTVSNMSKMLGRLLGADIALVERLAEDLCLVKADFSQIEQVILNLAVNARDAMPSGGTLTIETFNLQLGDDVASKNPDIEPGRYVVLAMRDTGCGMDENVKRQIFEPFFTTKENGKGTGLGLATVHGIVKQSGGHITASSEVGRGTVFHIYLPAVDGSMRAAKADVGTRTLSGGGETILLAEDKDDVRALTRRVLQSHGYKVLEAVDGEDALRLHDCVSESIHLLITDAIMPRMNGAELTRQLKKKHAGLKVLFISGYSDDLRSGNDAEMAASSFLQKPFTSKTLLAKVREVLCGEVLA